MHYRYGFNKGNFIVDKKKNPIDIIGCYQEYEYLFNKELSKKIAACIYKYIQVTDFCYREKYKKQLLEDYEFLMEAGRE